MQHWSSECAAWAECRHKLDARGIGHFVHYSLAAHEFVAR